MEQAALAFLPGVAGRQEYVEFVKLLLGVGLFVGVVTAVLATGVTSYLPFLFSPDAELSPIMKSIAPQVRMLQLQTVSCYHCLSVASYGEVSIQLSQSLSVVECVEVLLTRSVCVSEGLASSVQLAGHALSNCLQ